jgi:prephenate dehydrogenase
MAGGSGFRPAVCVVGGAGRMGGWFARFFAERGHAVSIADPAGRAPGRAVVEAAQVVLLAVPASAMAQALAEVGPWTRPGQLVVDICSLKEEPCRLMARHARCRTLGMHPLFGPGAGSLQGQTVFLCGLDGCGWSRWLQGLLQEAGARLVELEPRRHDRLMAVAQTMRHLLVGALAAAWEELGFDPRAEAHLAGPWFGRLLALWEQQSRQPAELYAELALANPYGRRAARCLASHLDRLAGLAERGQAQALVRALEAACGGEGEGAASFGLDCPAAEGYKAE